MKFDYPIFLSLEKKKCVVIGGGKVATRKILALLKSGAVVVVVAKEISKKILQWWREGKVRCFQREFRPSDLKGAWLVIAATNRSKLNETVANEAQKQRIWTNVVDQPSLCQMIYPSLIRRGKLTLAISTNGASPAMTKAIRKDLEKKCVAKYERSLRVIAKIRPKILGTVRSAEKRRRILNRLAGQLLK